MKSVVGKLLRWYKPDYTPRLLDLGGFGFLIAAAFVAFGLAPALAVTGVALLVIGWASE